MGLNSTKSSLTNSEYSLILPSGNHVYRGHSTIQGEFHLNIRKKFHIEKQIRIALIVQLIEHKNSSTKTNQNFPIYSFPLVTSHQNGIPRIIKQQQITFPFRIPLGMNLPPSCEFQEFSIIYYLDIYHDGQLLSNLRKKILLAPPIPHITIPLPCQITGSNDITIICVLQKSFYSGRNGSIIPLSISITNPKQKQIHSVRAQLIQIVSLNQLKHQKEILTIRLDEIIKNTQENQLNTICEINLPSNLPPTYIPNKNSQSADLPSIAITYEFRIITQMKDVTTPNLRLSVPIGIE